MEIKFTTPEGETAVWVEFNYLEETTEEEVHEKISKAMGTEEYEYEGRHGFPFSLDLGDAAEIASYLEVLNSHADQVENFLSAFDSGDIEDLSPEEAGEILEAMGFVPAEAIKAYLDNNHWNVSLSSIRDDYKGKFDSVEAYAKSLYEGNEAVAKVEAMGLHIDWKKVAYDMERSGCWIEDGHVFENS